MARLFKKKVEKKKSLWRRAVDLALTDVRVAVGGMDHESLETLEERLLTADFGVDATMRLVDHVEGEARRGKARGPEGLRNALRDELRQILEPSDDAYLHAAVELAAQLDCPVVATNDVRFLASSEFEAHEVRVCIHEGRTLDDPRRTRPYSEQQYLKN